MWYVSERWFSCRLGLTRIGHAGHGLCVECTEGFKAPTCSSCRAERGTHVPHAVYVDLVEDTPTAEARRLTRDLANLRDDTSTDNYRNLAKRIRDPQYQSGLSVDDKVGWSRVS
jgi:hypothetical protein